MANEAQLRDLARLLDFAVAAAYQAGQLTLEYFDRDIEEERKDDGTPVTEADRRAETLMRERIAAAFPDHGVIGEEYQDVNPAATHRWFLDPIDGTRSFVRGVPLYGVLLALEIERRVELGVAYFPAVREMLYAASGLGCRWNGRPCRVRDTGSLAESFVGFTDAGSFAAHGREATWRRILQATAYRAGWSDAYGHALVATGRLEVMLDPVMNPWDCGPFPVILREAGGYFGDWSGRETIYGNEALSTTRKLLPALLELTGERDGG